MDKSQFVMYIVTKNKAIDLVKETHRHSCIIIQNNANIYNIKSFLPIQHKCTKCSFTFKRCFSEYTYQVHWTIDLTENEQS